MKRTALTLLVMLLVSGARPVRAQGVVTVTGKDPAQWSTTSDSTLGKPAKIATADGRMKVIVPANGIVSFRVSSGTHHVVFQNAVTQMKNGVWEVVPSSGTLERLKDDKFPHYDHEDALASRAGTGSLIRIRVKDLKNDQMILFASYPDSDNATGADVPMLGVIVLAPAKSTRKTEGGAEADGAREEWKGRGGAFRKDSKYDPHLGRRAEAVTVH